MSQEVEKLSMELVEIEEQIESTRAHIRARKTFDSAEVNHARREKLAALLVLKLKLEEQIRRALFFTA